MKDCSGDLESGSALLIDLRPVNQYQIVNLPLSVNIQYEEFISKKKKELQGLLEGRERVVLMCRRGNNSRLAANFLLEQGFSVTVCNVQGGLENYINTLHKDVSIDRKSVV